MKITLLLWTVGSLWYGQSARYTRHGVPAPVRQGMVNALLISTLFAIVLTEGLSWLSSLNGWRIGIAWFVVAAGCTTWAVLQAIRTESLSRFGWDHFSRLEQYLLITTMAILGLTLLTGLLYPPNNFDSLTYHMGRVGHWQRQQTIEPFATHIERQIYQPPLAEWIILHTLLLTDGDGWANAVQWLAGIGCLTGLSLLSRQLGGSRTVQVATVFMGATVPMFILQLSSTQNDIMVSFYLIGLTAYLLRYYQRRHRVDILWAGLALGCALLTKGTAYVLGAPILLTWGLAELNRLFRSAGPGRIRWCSAVRLTGAGLLLVIMSIGLNAGHYARNLRVYNNPLTNGAVQSSYTNQVHSGTMLVSNVSRNIAVHLGFPGFHWAAQHGVETIHAWMNADVNDPRTTYAGSRFDLPMLSNNEDSGSNFVHAFWLTGTQGDTLCYGAKTYTRLWPRDGATAVFGCQSFVRPPTVSHLTAALNE